MAGIVRAKRYIFEEIIEVSHILIIKEYEDIEKIIEFLENKKNEYNYVYEKEEMDTFIQLFKKVRNCRGKIEYCNYVLGLVVIHISFEELNDLIEFEKR